MNARPSGALSPSLALGRYVTERVIVRSDKEIVYLAYAGARAVTIREFFPAELVTRAPDRATVVADDVTEFRRRLTQVVEKANALSGVHHPNVIPVREVFREHGTAYVVSDYIDVEPLGVDLSWKRATQIILRVLDGISGVHRAGVSHGAISATTVGVSKERKQVMVDLGAAAAVIGDADPSTDVRDVAALLQQLIANEDAPLGVRTAVDMALSEDPRQRPADALSFRRLLESGLGQSPLSMTSTRPALSNPKAWAMSATGTYSAPTEAAARRVWPVVVAIVVLAGLVAGWFLLR